MPLREIGALLLVLTVVFAVGNLWFHLVEWVLSRITGLFAPKDPPPWHPLPPGEGESGPDRERE